MRDQHAINDVNDAVVGENIGNDNTFSIDSSSSIGQSEGDHFSLNCFELKAILDRRCRIDTFDNVIGQQGRDKIGIKRKFEAISARERRDGLQKGFIAWCEDSPGTTSRQSLYKLSLSYELYQGRKRGGGNSKVDDTVGNPRWKEHLVDDLYRRTEKIWVNNVTQLMI